MTVFKFDNPFIAMMNKIANMMIVSFFWLLCCIPIVTIVPACSALYHTTVKVINGAGDGVVQDFFKTLRTNLRQGVILTIILAVSGLLLYLAYNLGQQMWSKSFFWAFYYVVGFFFAFIWTTMVIWVPPTLSRFEGSISVILKLSVYFASRSLLKMIFRTILLVLTLFLVDIYPILALILPGLYMDLIHNGIEKTMKKYMDENGLVEESADEEKVGSEGEDATLTNLEFDRLYSQEEEERK